MPTQILPLTGLDQTGVILDRPPVSLPPTAFSDVRNVRFKDGSVRKMEGELNIFPGILDTEQQLKYVAWWANPNLAALNSGYYVVIVEETVNNTQMDRIYLIQPGSSTLVEKGSYPAAPDGRWQHSFFQGGFCLILNNTQEAPKFLIDISGNLNINDVPDLEDLPGWESYGVPTYSISDIFNEATNSRIFDTNTNRSLITEDNYRLILSVAPPSAAPASTTIEPSSFDDTDVVFFGAFNTSFVSIADSDNIVVSFADTDLPDQSEVSISLESPPVNTTAGIVRSFGDFLVAGNLREIDNEGNVVRNLPGVVRSSDVALPGEVPTNWNPFAVGVSTADEFIIADTGIVQDMAELQGNFFIYSNTSISVMRLTGNAAVPLTISPITDSYGAQTTGSVLEFDGRHFVVGSQDIYLFAGHPGSIQSVSDGRVRRYFFDNLNPLQESRLFVLRYQQRDEIWLCFPSRLSISGEADQALIWNYRTNVWTIRDLNNVISGDIGPLPGGGVPNATLELSGTSGEDGIITPGVAEVQTFTTTNSITIPAPQFEVRRIEVDIPAYTAQGPEIFDFTVGPDFYSGDTDGDTLVFTFIVSNNNIFIDGFPFSVAMPPMLSGNSDAVVASIVDTLSNDSELSMHYRVTVLEGPTFRIETLLDSEGNQLIGDHDFHSITLNADIIDEGLLSSLNMGPSGVLTDMTGTDGTFNEYIDESFVGQYIFVGGAGGSPLPEGSQIQTGVQDTEVNFFQFLFGPNALLPGDSDSFFGPSAVGTGPVYDTIPVTYSSVIPPLMFDMAQNVQFRLLDSDGNPIANQEITLSAYTPIEPSSVADINLFNRPGGEDIEGVAPVLEIQTEPQIYDEDSDAFVDQDDPSPEIILSLHGDFDTDAATRNASAARLIIEAFNAQGTLNTGWVADTDSSDPSVVIVTANEYGPRRLDFSIVEDLGGTGVTANNFTITTTTQGIYDYVVDGNIDDGGVDAIAPLIRITPPDEYHPDIDVTPYDVRIPLQRLNADYIDTTDTEVAEALALLVNNNSIGWEQVGSTNRVQTIDINPEDFEMLAERDVSNTWTFEVLKVGNIVGQSFNIGDQFAVATETVAGMFTDFATPTYIGVVVSLGPDVYEVIILRGLINSSAETLAQNFANRIATANQRLLVSSENANINIQPINYDDLANFVLQVYFNDSREGAEAIQRLDSEVRSTGMITVDGTTVPATLNPFSDEIFINPGETEFVINTDTDGSDADFSAPSMASISTQFDVIRPWPTNEINPNLEYPIFSTRIVRTVFTDGLATGTAPYNRIVGADLGFSIPNYDTDIDTEVPYVSYIERLQLPVSPEFNTEEIQSIALWADGQTVKQYRGVPEYNKLDIRMAPSDNPGDIIDLTSVTKRSNIFEISEEYKIDMRVHGRLFNIRITDNIDIDTFNLPVSNSDKIFNKETEWRISGLQLEVMAGGRR